MKTTAFEQATLEVQTAALYELVHVALSMICGGGSADCDRVIRKIETAMKRHDGLTLAVLGDTRDAVRGIADREFGVAAVEVKS